MWSVSHIQVCGTSMSLCMRGHITHAHIWIRIWSISRSDRFWKDIMELILDSLHRFLRHGHLEQPTGETVVVGVDEEASEVR